MSKRPQRINQLFNACRIDGVMIPIHVKSDGLSPLVLGLREIHNLGGFVVTVPHKMAMVVLCDEVTPDARQIGAVNVVRRTPDRRLLGTMLDGEGFVACAKKVLNPPVAVPIWPVRVAQPVRLRVAISSSKIVDEWQRHGKRRI